MRAAWYERTGKASEVLKHGELETPTTGPGQVLVRLHASGVNPADVKARSGWLDVHKNFDRVIPNCDGAGVVEAVGPDVEKTWIGKRVWVHISKENPHGTAAEYMPAALADIHPLPDNISFIEGACVGVPVATAHHIVLVDGPVHGQTVLVAGGAGVVAHYAIQIAKLGGATVITTVSSPEKAAHAKAAGAHHIINYREVDVATRIMDITNGAGVDRIIEVDLGANMALDAKVIKPDGVVASYSSTSNREPVLPYYAFALKGVTLHLVQAYVLTPEKRRRMFDDITGWLAAGALQFTVGRHFKLTEIVAAHEAVEQGTVMGKVIIDLD